MKNLVFSILMMSSTAFGCEYCEACRLGLDVDENSKIYVESNALFVQDGQILFMHDKLCYFLNGIQRDDHGVFFYPYQVESKVDNLLH